MAKSPQTKSPSALDRANTKKALNEAAAAEALTRRLTLEAADIEHEQSMRSASEWENRIYVFDAEVNAGTVQECMRILGLWVRRNTNEPITIVFNSPGGGVFDGLALYDFILQLRERGTQVNTTALGMAASMGAVLLQAGETRRMAKNSYLMIHEVSSAAMGTTSEIADKLKLTGRLQKRLLDILAERSNLSLKQIERKWKKKDWWLGAEEALELGFCDEVE